MLKYFTGFLLTTAILFAFGKDILPAPGIGGIAVGTPREEAFKKAHTGDLFKNCEISQDSNAMMIGSKAGAFILEDSVKISSIKVMFNKKKSVQALSVVCRTQTADAVEGVYRFAEKLLGPAREASPGKIGFKFEAEWDTGKYSGTLFASDQAFETYLLLAYKDFVNEEELRGTNHPK